MWATVSRITLVVSLLLPAGIVAMAEPVAAAGPSYTITEISTDPGPARLSDGQSVAFRIAPIGGAPDPSFLPVTYEQNGVITGSGYYVNNSREIYISVGGVPGVNTYSITVGDTTSATITRTLTKGTANFSGSMGLPSSGMVPITYNAVYSCFACNVPAPTGTYSLIQDDTTTLATFPATSPGSYNIPESAVTNHFVKLVYSGDSNFDSSSYYAMTLNRYVPVTIDWLTTTPVAVNGQPSMRVKLSAGPYTYMLAGRVVRLYIDGQLLNSALIEYANSEATGLFTSANAVHWGSHDYRANLEGNGIFTESSSATLPMTLDPYPTKVEVSNPVFTPVKDNPYLVGTLKLTATFSATAPVPFNLGLSSYTSAWVDSTGNQSQPINLDTYLICTTTTCTKDVAYGIPKALPYGRHSFVLQYDGSSYFGRSSAAIDFTATAPPAPNYYRATTATGKVSSFGIGGRGQVDGTLNSPIVGSASTPTDSGYWLVASDGGIFTFGNAPFLGSMGGTRLNKPIVGMAATPSGNGYWLVASDGGIFAFGDAGFYGSMGGKPLNQPIVGMSATPTGKGYWFVASDGGVFAFGDAKFFGSMGGKSLNKPIVGMAAVPGGGGYWFVASDGGIFSFGVAKFYGSTGNIKLNQPIVGMKATPSSNGYWFIASDGGVFSFGDAGFFGTDVSGKNGTVVGLI